jgi:hypothetical protein
MLCYHNEIKNYKYIFVANFIASGSGSLKRISRSSWANAGALASEELNAGTSVADLDPGFFLPHESGICIRDGGKNWIRDPG